MTTGELITIGLIVLVHTVVIGLGGAWLYYRGTQRTSPIPPLPEKPPAPVPEEKKPFTPRA